ncbi:MAG: BrnT family toxin [Desulfobacula sp.]|nr:BrnT family toxin [Desulfobacula sp.]
MNKIHKGLLSKYIGFDWDNGNIDKNRLKHKVNSPECEQIFFNHPLVVQDDIMHSKTEKRFYALGRTDSRRTLFIVFTVRNSLIRVISARDMSRKKGRDITMSKRIPKFKNEDEEMEFWATHDSTEYINWNRAERITFSNLKPSVKKISLRLPESMLEELKLLANKRDVPYQSLLKIFLAERIEKELGAH